LIIGAAIPNFSDFLYYYQIEVSGFTQMDYGYINLVGYVSLFLSIFLYYLLFKKWEIKLMMVSALVINAAGAGITVMYTTEHTLGMSPLAFVFLTTTITDVLFNAYRTMPAMVLFAKLIPENVESFMFAMITGLMNLSNLFLSRELGILINHFIGVYYDSSDDNNLRENVWKLYCVQAACCGLPLFFLWLLPSRQDVKQV